MFSHANNGQMGQSSGNNTKKPLYLKKSSDGSTFLPWLKELKNSLAWHGSSAVQQHGCNVLMDEEDWIAEFKVDYEEADDVTKAELAKEKSARNQARTIVFNLVMALLSDEVKQLVEAESGFRALEGSRFKSAFELLKIVKRVVTTGITSDLTYQCMINLRNLHDVKQKPHESVRQYADRVKAAVDVFESVSPYGNVFVEPDMTHRRPAKRLNSRMGFSGDGEVGDERMVESHIESKYLIPVTPASGWVTSKYAVMVAIMGLSAKHETVKNEWKLKLQDKNGAGTSIPESLDDLVERVANHSAIDKEFAKNEAIEVNSTQVRGKAKGYKGSKSGKAGDKSRPDSNKGQGPTCHLCKEVGHYKRNCPQLKSKSEQDSSDKEDSDKGQKKGKRKKNAKETGSEIVVKATETMGSYESEFIDAHDQFCFYATESVHEDHEFGGDASAVARVSSSVLFDNCANESIICNVELLTDVRKIDVVGEVVKTMYGSVQRKYEAVGTLVIAGIGHQVYVDLNATDNIVSYGKFEEACIRQGYSCWKPARRSLRDRPIAVQVLDTDSKVVLTVYGEGRMARCDLSREVNIYVTDFGKTISKEDMERAVLARQLQSRLGNASMTAVGTMLARGSVITSIKGKDLVLAKDALGPNIVEQKAKRARVKASVKRIRVEDADDVESGQKLYGDIFSTMGKEFLIAVLEPMHLICTDNMPSDRGFTHKEITASLTKVRAMMKDSGFEVEEVHFDSAGKKGELSTYPDIKVHPPGQHVAQAERGIRTVKECLRGFVQDRPWLPWWGRFAVQAVAAASMYISLRHAKNSKSKLSPYQQLTGTTPVVDRDFKAAFGDLVLVENLRDEASKSLVTRPRMIEAVWLRPSFDDHGSAVVLLLDSGVIAVRILSTRIEWEGHQQELNRLYAWSGAPRTDTEMKEVQFVEGGKVYDLRTIKPDLGADVIWERGTEEDDVKVLIGRSSGGFPLPTRHEQGIDLPDAPGGEDAVGMDSEGVTPSELKEGVGDPGPTTSAPDMGDVADVGAIGDVATSRSEETAVSDIGGPQTGVVDRRKGRKRKSDLLSEGYTEGLAEQVAQIPGSGHDPDDIVSEQPDQLVLDVSERGRVRRKSFKLFATESGKTEEVVTTRIAKGMHEVNRLTGEWKYRAEKALISEIENLVKDHDTVTGVLPTEVEPGDVILPASVIIEDKAVNGRSVKDKGRIIAGGHRQNKQDFVNLSTQTVNTESVFILLAVAAYEKRTLMVVDVKGAYLNADMSSPNGKDTFIKVDRSLAKMFVRVEPNLGRFVAADGTLLLRLDKALYGCIQSSALWQEKLTATLIEMGFRISSYDKCVAVNADGSVIVCFHVDDLMVAGKNVKCCEKFRDDLGKRFTITSTVGNELDYLGLHIHVKEHGIELSQKAMVTKLLGNVKGTANSPAASLESEEGLNEEELKELDVSLDVDMAAEYRSVTAVALYLSKRTRPDLLMAVNRLCRKANKPTVRDWKALQRLLRYVSKTRNHVLMMPATSLDIEAYIDASFATNADRKSTTGAVVMVGGAIVWCKSGKQGIITKSSFEAELVALSDMSSMVLWINLFMRDLGFQANIPIIYQDNQSTMRVAEKGLSNNPSTKHIDIRYLWIKEVLQQRKLLLKYMRTDKMIADGMTKPLVGESFYKFVDSLNLVPKASSG